MSGFVFTWIFLVNRIFAYTEKCISKRGFSSIDIKNFLYYHVDNFICMKICQEYSYLHGKLFKTDCLQFFFFKKMHWHRSNAWEIAMIFNFIQKSNCIYRLDCICFIWRHIVLSEMSLWHYILNQGNKNVIIIDASLRIDRYCKFQMALKFSNWNNWWHITMPLTHFII